MNDAVTVVEAVDAAFGIEFAVVGVTNQELSEYPSASCSPNCPIVMSSRPIGF